MSDSNPTEKGVEDDKELEDLLDSAIEDFDKPSKASENHNALAVSEVQGDDEEWGKEFLVEAQKHFEQNLKVLFGQDALEEGASIAPDQFSAQLQKMAEEANKVLNEQAKNPEFSETIAQTLKNLSENSENLEEVGNITSMMEDLGLGSGNGPDFSSDMLPLIQSVMKSFLSKDLLYGPIKEITEKYPTWLEEHKNNLVEEDYENYKKQFHLMEDVCKEFEEEKDSDSDDVKNKRFTKVLTLMEEMQKLGQPPKDLVGEAGPFGLDETNLASQLPGIDQSQCVLM